MAEAKGICPVCNENVSVRRDGLIRHHGYQKGTGTRVSCPGAGQEPRTTSDGAFSPTCVAPAGCEGPTEAIVWTGSKWVSACADHASGLLRHAHKVIW